MELILSIDRSPLSIDVRGCRDVHALRHPSVYSIKITETFDRIIENDRYPLSPRIRALKEIRALIKPYPAREPSLPPTKQYEPPSKGRYRRRR
jgi:hypothetical protein